jgi:hypothetical protein
MGQDLCGRLPWDIAGPTEGRVAGVGVSRERAEIGHHAGAERIQVEVADQLQKIEFFFYDDGLVPVLKEMSCPLVPMACPPMVD